MHYVCYFFPDEKVTKKSSLPAVRQGLHHLMHVSLNSPFEIKKVRTVVEVVFRCENVLWKIIIFDSVGGAD